MATYDDPYNPIPRRLREPTPGYSQTRLPGTERTVVETPRGGFSPDPAAGLSERDLTPENYAMPFSPTRSMRYGPGDERDLGAPVVDPRSPLAPSPTDWSEVRPYGSGRAAFDGRGGYAYMDAPAVPDQSTPRPLFSGVAGEDFEATRRRGEQVAKLMRETDGPFANPNDWNYVRSYGPRAAAQAVASGRANISGAPPELVAQERERFLRNRTTDLSISPQLRSAARDELAQIERDAAEERRREMWAAEQAARLGLERYRIDTEQGGLNDRAIVDANARQNIAQTQAEATVNAAKAEADARVAAAEAQGASAAEVERIRQEGQAAVERARQEAETERNRLDNETRLGIAEEQADAPRSTNDSTLIYYRDADGRMHYDVNPAKVLQTAPEGWTDSDFRLIGQSPAIKKGMDKLKRDPNDQSPEAQLARRWMEEAARRGGIPAAGAPAPEAVAPAEPAAQGGRGGPVDIF